MDAYRNADGLSQLNGCKAAHAQHADIRQEALMAVPELVPHRISRGHKRLDLRSFCLDVSGLLEHSTLVTARFHYTPFHEVVAAVEAEARLVWEPAPCMSPAFPGLAAPSCTNALGHHTLASMSVPS